MIVSPKPRTRRNRKALCSIGCGPYEQLLAITGPTFERYAQRHGYDLVLRTEVDTNHRPAPWAKVPLLLELLEEYEVVLWVDADAIIMDDTVDVAAEVRPDKWMYLARNTTSEGLVPNTGVWMFTRGPAARDFLEAVYAHEGCIDHRWWENAAVIDLLGYRFDPVRPGPENRFTSGVRYLDPAWNSIGADPAARPRIKHYAGLPFPVRYESLLADAAAARATTELIHHVG